MPRISTATFRAEQLAAARASVRRVVAERRRHSGPSSEDLVALLQDYSFGQIIEWLGQEEADWLGRDLQRHPSSEVSAYGRSLCREMDRRWLGEGDRVWVDEVAQINLANTPRVADYSLDFRLALGVPQQHDYYLGSPVTTITRRRPFPSAGSYMYYTQTGAELPENVAEALIFRWGASGGPAPEQIYLSSMTTPDTIYRPPSPPSPYQVEDVVASSYIPTTPPITLTPTPTPTTQEAAVPATITSISYSVDPTTGNHFYRDQGGNPLSSAQVADFVRANPEHSMRRVFHNQPDAEVAAQREGPRSDRARFHFDRDGPTDPEHRESFRRARPTAADALSFDLGQFRLNRASTGYMPDDTRRQPAHSRREQARVSAEEQRFREQHIRGEYPPEHVNSRSFFNTDMAEAERRLMAGAMYGAGSRVSDRLAMAALDPEEIRETGYQLAAKLARAILNVASSEEGTLEERNRMIAELTDAIETGEASAMHDALGRSKVFQMALVMASPAPGSVAGVTIQVRAAHDAMVAGLRGIGEAAARVNTAIDEVMRNPQIRRRIVEAVNPPPRRATRLRRIS